MRKIFGAMLMWAALPAVAQVPVGGEFEVGSGPGNESFPSVAMAQNGGFGVAWMRLAADNIGSSIMLRLFRPDGRPLARETQANQSSNLFLQGPSNPSIAMNGRGQAAVVWEAPPTSVFHGKGVFMQRFKRRGDRKGPQLRLNATNQAGRDPFIARTRSGKGVVVWEDLSGLVARRVRRNGRAVGRPNRVFSFFPVFSGPEVSMGTGASAVVSFEDYAGTGALLVQPLNAAARPIAGSVIPVAPASGALPSFGPQRTAVDEGGEFVVVWDQGNQIFARRLTRTGRRIGPDILVAGDGGPEQLLPAVVIFSDGRFLVLWWRQGGSPGLGEIVARGFARDGGPFGGEFLVSETSVVRGPSFHSVATDGAARAVVVWTSLAVGSEPSRVMARLIQW